MERIVPSLIASSQEELDERARKLKGCFFHLDVMDGAFVPNKSLLFDFSFREKSEAHLMMKKPCEWLKENAGDVDRIIIHAESDDASNAVKMAKASGKKVGIAINPGTPADAVEEYAKRIDKIVVMTVHPGAYGTTFLPETLGKIKQLRKMYPDVLIEADGGVSPETIEALRKAGADLFVAGSYLQNSDEPLKAKKELEMLVK